METACKSSQGTETVTHNFTFDQHYQVIDAALQLITSTYHSDFYDYFKDRVAEVDFHEIIVYIEWKRICFYVKCFMSVISCSLF